jgi:hypothetical protein
MKLVQFIVAAAILIPAAGSFAQSTPPALNEDVRTQLAQEKLGYGPSDSNEQKQNSLNNVKQNGSQSRQITGMNLGRYSLAVVVPTY